jgi:tRNA pseudouridine38-40 synthase
MPRYFLAIAYNGTLYNGFASQISNNNKVKTVQGLLDDALAIALKCSIQSTTSSRTDAGVHARQNYLHFDTEATIPSSIIYSLNSILPKDISVLDIKQVPDTLHSRFEQIKRSI